MAKRPSTEPQRSTAEPQRSRAEPQRFQAERRALGKIQLHFEFQQSVLRNVRMRAAAENLSYADFVRKAVGLPHGQIQRPRISLSFSQEDLQALAQRYGQRADEPNVLKRCVLEEISARLGAHDAQGKP